MPLDVTAGPPLAVAGSGPPGPAAGPSEAGTPSGSGTTPPFAALLALQVPPLPPLPVTPGGTPKATGLAPVTAGETEKPKDDDPDTTEPQSAAAVSPLDPTTVINWTALAALQAPTQVSVQTATPLTTDTAVSSAASTKDEVMDIAPVAVSAALPAQTQDTGRGLLPLPADTSAQTSVLPEGSATSGAPSGVAALAVPASAAATDAAAVVAPPQQPVADASRVLSSQASLLSVAAPSVSVSTQTPSVAVATSQVAQASQAVTVLPPASDMTAVIVPKMPPASKRQPQTVAAPRPTVTATPVASPKTPLAQSAVADTSSAATSVTDASTTPSLPPAVTAPQSEKAAPVTLQNDAAPANNTGRTASSGDTTVPTTAPAGETGDGQPATVAASKTAVFSSENTTQTALISRSSRQKETDKAKEADPSLSSAPQAGPSGTDGAVTDGTVAATLIAPSTDVSTSSSTLTGITQKPLTGAERAQIVRQLADGVATVKPQVLTNGQGQMTLDLHPKEWGDLRVTIKLAQGQTAEGVSQTVVTAHVVASSPVVKAALETHTAELNRALHETGLRLDRLTVTVQDASAGSQSGGSGTGGGGSSQQSSDRWQTSQPQAGSESSGIGGGGSSSFAAFSERHGGDTPQNRVTTRSAYASADGSDTSVPSLPDRSPRISAGFDQRA